MNDPTLWAVTCIVAQELSILCDKSPNGVTWKQIEETMHQQLVVEQSEHIVDAVETLVVNQSTDWFKFSGTANEDKVNSVQEWILDFIDRAGLRNKTKMEGEILKKISEVVASTGASVTWNPLTLVHKKEIEKETIVDVGMINFPTAEDPHFDIYRLKVEACRSSSRWLFGESNESFLEAEVSTRRFIPRKEFIAAVKKKNQKAH
jgi:hypothetical protein